MEKLNWSTSVTLLLLDNSGYTRSKDESIVFLGDRWHESNRWRKNRLQNHSTADQSIVAIYRSYSGERGTCVGRCFYMRWIIPKLLSLENHWQRKNKQQSGRQRNSELLLLVCHESFWIWYSRPHGLGVKCQINVHFRGFVTGSHSSARHFKVQKVWNGSRGKTANKNNWG